MEVSHQHETSWLKTGLDIGRPRDKTKKARVCISGYRVAGGLGFSRFSVKTPPRFAIVRCYL